MRRKCDERVHVLFAHPLLVKMLNGTIVELWCVADLFFPFFLFLTLEEKFPHVE